jgi:hypothetical protein
MVSLPGFSTLDKKAPGKVADWSVAISPADPAVTARLVSAPPFAGADALAGAALGLIGGSPPPLITFDRGGHYARIEVDAQVGLSGGGFALVLQRALPDDYDRLAAAKTACDAKNVPLVAEVSLGWTSNRGLPGMLGPSSEGLEPAGAFAITEITPSVEGVAYRIALHGRELFGYRLSQRRITKAEVAKTPEDAVVAVLKLLGFADDDYLVDKDNPPPPPATQPEIKLALGQDGLTEVQRIGTLIEAFGKRQGRKPFLVRDRVLHIGVGRAIPFMGPKAEGKVVRVSTATGMIGYAETRAMPRDPKFDFAEAFAAGNLTATPEMRRGFRLDLVGAPEIRPGDVVAFPPAKDPTSAAPVELPLSEDWDKAIELYVDTVSHRIEPNAGFMTTVTGVQVETAGGTPTSLWDVPSEAPVKATTPGARGLDDGTAEGALSNSVAQSVERALARYALAEVAEVAAEGDPSLLPLASNLVVGLSDQPSYMRRSAINDLFREGQGVMPSVPYASPFAWGPFGLVVPRYPGTRVMLLPGHGDNEDAVDIGALWHGPPGDATARPSKARQGDWWLKLPARIEPATSDAVVAGPVAPPAEALATNDLTDAEGNRFIEVGQLVIRVGDKALQKGTERPAAGSAPAAAIVIEQKDGEALITIDAEGKVTIKAKNVAVEVSGTMDVKKTS